MLIQWTAVALEFSGIAIIALGALLSTVRALAHYMKRIAGIDLYAAYRTQLSRAILLGLEFLVAADIIRTVAIEPTFRSVGILAAIVAIRTFLSFTLEVEISGRWPWSHGTGRGKTEVQEQRVPADSK